MSDIYFYIVLCLYVAAFVFWFMTQREWVGATIGSAASGLAAVYYFTKPHILFGAAYAFVAGMAAYNAYKSYKKDKKENRGSVQTKSRG